MISLFENGLLFISFLLSIVKSLSYTICFSLLCNYIVTDINMFLQMGPSVQITARYP